MKVVLIVFLMIVTMNGFATAQTTDEKEIILSGIGRIVLEDGTELSGEISHSLLHELNVSIKTDMYERTFKIKEVRNFTIGSLFFEKIVTSKSVTKTPEFALLLSSPSSTIRVYEISWQEIKSLVISTEKPTTVTITTNREYFVLFPKLNAIKEFSDLAFIPFVKKVSKLTEDCPTVSEKIKNKEKGYFISLIATDLDKIQVFKNIADAYADCE